MPRPPESGTFDVIRNSKSSGGQRRANPRTTRLRRSRAIERSVTTPKRPVSTTSTSMCMASAAARTSKPGPRLAEEAGTRTSRRRLIAGLSPSTACSTASISGSQGTTEPAWPSAVCGSLRPWPVSTHTIRAGALGAVLEQPRHRPAAEAGSQNTPSWPASQR